MRLGQLARKYDISIEEVISYIKEIGAYHEELLPNSKLDKDTSALLAKQFEPTLSIVSEELVEPTEQLEEVLEEPIAGDEDKEEETQDELDILLPESEYEVLPATTDSDSDEKENVPIETETKSIEEEGESIETDELLALLESEESEVDLSHITLIKASKKELTGLKVLGKIELEEPVTKPTEKAEEEESPKDEAEDKQEREQLNLVEREEKILMFKKRRENYEAKQERQERKKLEQRKKAVKKAHYQGKIKNTKPIQPKKKEKITKPQETLPEVVEQQPKPKTFFGKLWSWLDAPS